MPETYNTLVPSNTLYIKSPNPGCLIIEGIETQCQIAQHQDEQVEALHMFQDCQGVERALLEQIVATEEP